MILVFLAKLQDNHAFIFSLGDDYKFSVDHHIYPRRNLEVIMFLKISFLPRNFISSGAAL